MNNHNANNEIITLFTLALQLSDSVLLFMAKKINCLREARLFINTKDEVTDSKL